MDNFTISNHGMGGVGTFELEGETHKESTTAKPGYGYLLPETVRDRKSSPSPHGRVYGESQGGRARSAAVG